MGKSKEQKAAQKAAKKAERQEKWNATKEKAKEKFSKLGSKVKKVFKPEDKSTAQKTNAEVFETAVSNLKKLRLELSAVRNSAGDMFIKDGSNAKTYVDQDAFDQYNSQIKALSKRIIEIKNQINASVEGLHEKESRSESLKTLNTLNTILTRIAEVWDRISEVDLPAGENYPESLINELRQLLSQLDLFVKNIKSISKKHAVFGGPALEQLPDLRAILNLFLSDFTGMIVQINNTMDNTSKPKSFKYSTKLDDGTKVGVKAISGNVGKVVTNKRELKRDHITRLLNATSNISNGADRASEIQRILRSAEHVLNLMFEDIRSNVSAVHRAGLGAADQMLTEYLEHQMELLRRLEALYHTNAYGPPSTFKDQLAAMINKAENMKKKVRNLLKKLSSKVQKTSQYSTIIEILDTIDKSVDDMVNAIGLVLPELPVKEQPSGSDKDDVDDENNDDNHNDNDRPDDNDVNRPTNSKDGDNEHHPDTERRTARRDSESAQNDRADRLYRIATEQDAPPNGTTPLKARSELKELAETNNHAYDLWKTCKLMPKTNTSTQTGPRLNFENQTIYEKSPQGLPPTIYRRRNPTRPPTDVARSRRSSDISGSSNSTVPRPARQQTPRRTRSDDSLDRDVMSELQPRVPSENSIRELTGILDQPMDYQNTVQQNQAMEKLKELANNDQAARLALSRYTLNGLDQQKWSQAKSQIDQDISTLRAGECSQMVASDIIKNLHGMSLKFGGYATRMYDKAKQIDDDLDYAKIEPGQIAADGNASSQSNHTTNTHHGRSITPEKSLGAIEAELEKNSADVDAQVLLMNLRLLDTKAEDENDPDHADAVELKQYYRMGMNDQDWLQMRKQIDSNQKYIMDHQHTANETERRMMYHCLNLLKSPADRLGGYAGRVYRDMDAILPYPSDNPQPYHVAATSRDGWAGRLLPVDDSSESLGSSGYSSSGSAASRNKKK